MAINVYIASTLQNAIAGSSYADDLDGNKVGLDNGSVTNGGETASKIIAIAHDHTVQTVAAYIYYQKLTPAAGETYAGSFTPESDFERIIGWGDDDCGFQVETDWDDVSPSYAEILKTGNMDEVVTALLIPADSMAYDDTGTTQPPSAPVTGEIYPIGNASRVTKGEGCQVLQKIVVPADELVNGFCEIDTVIIMDFVS